MKYCFTVIFLFLVNIYVQAQQIDVFGKVMDEQGVVLMDATIQYEENQNTVVESNGSFYFKTSFKKSFKIVVRHIGYVTVDTLIDVGNSSEVFINIEMKTDTEELPSVEITASIQNVFDNYQHHIIDFLISKDQIFVIVQKGRKSFLSKANLQGIIIEEIEIDSRYKKFHSSCLGGIILVGGHICAEVHEIDDELLITNEFDIERFEKYIIPCQLKINETLIFKGISRHNKKVDYFRYYENYEPHILFTVYDEDSEKVSRSYFSDLLGLYNYQTENISPNDIDAGFGRENVIKDGMWNGDIQDLIITNLTHEYAMKYLSLGLKSVKTDIFVINNKVYILDEFNHQILRVDDALESVSKVDDINQKGEIEIITDYKKDSYFLIDDLLYRIEIEKGAFQIVPFKEIEHHSISQRNQLNDGVLYRLGRKSFNSIKKSLVKVDLD